MRVKISDMQDWLRDYYEANPESTTGHYYETDVDDLRDNEIAEDYILLKHGDCK